MRMGRKSNIYSKLLFGSVCFLMIAVLSIGLGFPGSAENVFVSADTIAAIQPIAKYEFRDSSDPGKDSMGKYHLTTREAGGTAPTVDAEAGTIKFNKNIKSVLRETSTNMLQDITSITLAADIILPANVGIWQTPFGFGRTSSTLTTSPYFLMHSGGSSLRAGITGIPAVSGEDAVQYNMPIAYDYGSKTTGWNNISVVLSVQAYGKARIYVYVNGSNTNQTHANWINGFDMGADWNSSLNSLRFALGGNYNGINADSAFDGTLSNVNIFDFAMTAEEVEAYRTNGQLTEAELTAKVAPLGANVDLSGSIAVSEDDSNQTILASYPSSLITASMTLGASRQVKAVWTGVEVENGNKYLTGTISGAPNPDSITAKAKIKVDVFSEIYPIARYKFEDAGDLGKDSMGNHHLVQVGDGTLSQGGIGVVFGGDAVLAEPAGAERFTKDLTAFTVSFDVSAESNPGWATPLGFGANSLTGATKWLYFQYGDPNTGLGISRLRFGANHPDGAPALEGAGNSGYTQSTLRDNLSADTTYRVVMTADTQRSDGRIKIYIDGVLTSYDRAANQFNIGDDAFRFALGGVLAEGQIRSLGKFHGQVGNVDIFDFEMSSAQVSIYSGTGKLKTNNASSSYITDVEQNVEFVNGAEFASKVYDKMTEVEILSRLNRAKVNANLNDGVSSLELNVVWTSVFKRDTGFVAQGKVAPVGLGIASAVNFSEVIIEHSLSEIEVAYNITVNNTILNGSVSVTESYGAAGDTITLTVTPDRGYEIDSVSFNSTPIIAYEGEYSFVMGTEDVEITAIFAAVQRSITVGALQNGVITVSSDKGIIGDRITLIVTAENGYIIDKVYANNLEIIPVEGVYGFAVDIADIEITADFKYAPYIITIGTLFNGSVTADKTQAANGDTITLEVVADTGYAVDKVYANGTEIVPVTGLYQLVVDGGNITVTATFVQIQYSITTTDTVNGSITLSKATAALGEIITIIITPDKGYKLKSIAVNGKVIEPVDGFYAFTVGGASVLTTEFEKAGNDAMIIIIAAIGVVIVVALVVGVIIRRRQKH